MSYKNTMKLFTSNFVLVWKQLLYLLVCLLIFILFSYVMANPIIDLLKENGIMNDINTILSTAYNSPSEVALNLSDFFKHLTKIIFTNFDKIWLNFFGTIIFAILLPYLLIQLSFYNLSSIVYQKMSMNMNVKYIQNGMQTFKQSIKYALTTILINIPFMVISILLLYVYVMSSTTVISAIIGLVLLFALLIFITAVRMTIFTCFVGQMVQNNSSPFTAFGKGLKSVMKNFWKILSVSIMILLTIILVNGFIALFTFLSGLLITIPATFVVLSIYYLVIHLNIQGERYYLGDNFIFNPVKYKVKKEDYTIIDYPEEPKEVQVKTTTLKKKKSKKTKNTTNN